MHTYTHAKELRQFRADIHTYVHTGSSILRPSFTHMPVTHASVPGCSAPNALLLPATASQSKGSALAALAWQRGQHVHGHQSIRTLSSQHPSFCFHCIMKQVLPLGKFSWQFKKEDKSSSAGRTNSVGAALSSSVSHL